MKRNIKFVLFTFVTSILILVAIFLFQVYREIEKKLLITNRGYPLTNGYSYSVLGTGRHRLLGNSRQIELGYHLNRLYFDDRYIVGEITEEPDNPEQLNQERRHSYFIFDTNTAHYTPNLNESEFETELRKLGIWEDVKLSSRDDRNWLKQQKSRS